MALSSSELDPIEELVEEFLARRRRGERPTVEEYLERYPALASGIRAIFPAMAVVNDLGAGSAVTEGAGGAEQTAEPKTGFVGDYRIIREIGRGGMGVVYEAEQVSLGRRVALKLLPERVIADAKHRGRFEREARAAAQLHHTNIVPVFGVGEHQGSPYYVMQLIDGRGLDAVIAELRRLAEMEAATVLGTPAGTVSTHDHEAAEVARSLLDGRLGTAGASTTDPAASGSPIDETGDHGGAEVASGGATAGTFLDGTGEHVVSAGTAAREPERTVTTGPASSGLSSDSFAGKSGPSSGRSYWQAVARVGAQVAEALAHAHAQGIVHRDIKPSNLLMDSHGLVWVADFGLAKATDSAELTETGEVLGTLRYMPPEAFRGETGALGDVYSLGLTLYEMIALRPAFDQPDRARLIHAVTESQPAPLRDLARKVPRDLETIVRKATEREPSHRYASAAALAEDLRRFAEDRPISARRINQAERLWRWSRRNPLPAGLAAGLVVALLAGSAASAFYALRERRANAYLEKANENLKESVDRERERVNLAMDAIKLFHGEVSQDLLLKQKEFSGLRTKLLSAASDFYNKLEGLLASQGDAESRATLIRSYEELASLTAQVGNEADALVLMRKALAERRELAARPGAGPAATLDVATGLLTVASASMVSGDRAGALAATQEARGLAEAMVASGSGGDRERAEVLTADSWLVESDAFMAGGDLIQALAVAEKGRGILERLCAEQPDNPQYREKLARAFQSTGSTLGNLGRNEEALADFERAKSEFARLGEAGRERLAASHQAAGFANRRLGRDKESLAEFEQARDIYNRLVAEQPAVSSLAFDAADAEVAIAHVLSSTGHVNEALKSYEQAIDQLSRLAKANPTVLKYANMHRGALMDKGTLLTEVGRKDEGFRAMNEALLIAERNAADHPDLYREQIRLNDMYAAMGFELLKIGRAEEATAMVGKAVALYEKLYKEHPDLREVRRGLVIALNTQGDMLSQLGRVPEAAVAFQRLITVAEPLVAEQPMEVTTQDYLAGGYGNLGLMLMNMRRTGDGLEFLQKAVNTLGRLSGEHPDNRSYRENLAKGFNMIGAAFYNSGRFAEAVKSFEQAISLQESLIVANPSIEQPRLDLGQTLTNCAPALERAGRMEDAKATYEKGGRLLEALVESRPDVPSYAKELGRNLGQSGELMVKMGRVAEGLQLLERSRAIAEKNARSQPNNGLLQQSLATATSRIATVRSEQGDINESIRLYRQVIAIQERFPKEAPSLYDLGCTYSLLYSAEVRNGSGINPSTAEAEGLLAVATLRRAVESGFRDVAHMRTDSDLVPLYQRRDFQELLMDAAFPADVFAK